MNTNTRLSLDDNFPTIFMKMSEGNPGALSVLISMFKENQRIDPMDIFAGVGPILSLDTLGIYGPRIWMLFKDVCKQDLVHTLACLRAVQLGLMSEDVLNHAIDHRGEGLDVNETYEKVKSKLPSFHPTESESFGS